jgi:hypothetical protein
VLAILDVACIVYNGSLLPAALIPRVLWMKCVLCNAKEPNIPVSAGVGGWCCTRARDLVSTRKSQIVLAPLTKAHTHPAATKEGLGKKVCRLGSAGMLPESQAAVRSVLKGGQRAPLGALSILQTTEPLSH